MSDRLFFPLILLLSGLMVWLAVLPGIGRLPEGAVAGDGVNYDRILIEGAYLNKVIAGGQAQTVLDRREDGPYQLLIAHEAQALNDAPALGPHFRLAADIEQQFAGRRIRATVRARPAPEQGAVQMMVNYATSRDGESGWQVFDLQPGFAEFSFEYQRPAQRGEQGVDYFAIRPVVPDKRRAIIVDRIILERLS